jgi:CheY-like chemotaxis protein
VSYRVLHIDDDPLMRDVVEHSLNLDPAFTLASCASGDEALAVAGEWPPDLILCDVMMPEMDGPAVLARLREAQARRKSRSCS